MINNGLLANIGIAQGDLMLKVKGETGANNFQMGPNSRVALFDEDNDIFFVKTTDANGQAIVRAFDFTERKSDYPEKYLTTEKFEEFMQQFNDFREEITNGQFDIREPESGNDQHRNGSKTNNVKHYNNSALSNSKRSNTNG